MQCIIRHCIVGYANSLMEKAIRYYLHNDDNSTPKLPTPLPSLASVHKHRQKDKIPLFSHYKLGLGDIGIGNMRLLHSHSM